MGREIIAIQAQNNRSRGLLGNYVRWVLIALAAAIIAAGSYLAARYNYNLFHSFADGVTVLIAAGVFFVVWNGRRRLDNHYLLFVGIAFLFFAFLDFVHLLGNKNMGVFPKYGNLGSTLYIASRYVLSISLVLAPLFIKRKLNTAVTFAGYTAVTALIILSIFYWKVFPITYIEGVGLTPFKIISDYIICAILLGAIVLLFINRRAFEARLFKIIVSSLVLSIATGLAFTLYTDPFGITNMVGHFFQIASFYLIYVGFVETALTRPQDILFRSLKQSREEALKLNTELAKANLDLKQENTERKKAEELVRAQRQLLEITFNNVPAQMNLMGRDLRILLANPAYQRIAPGKQMVGKTLNELWPETGQDFARLCRQVLATGEPYHVVDDLNMVSESPGMPPVPKYFTWSLYRVSLPEGGYGILNVAWETTDRKKVEEALRASEQRWATTLASIGDGVIATDVDGKVTFMNAVSQALTGWTLREAFNRPISDVFHIINEKSRREVENPVVRVIREGNIVNLANHTVLIRKDGTEIPIDDSGAPINNESGVPIGVVLVFRDITTRRKAEQIQEEFIGMVSHELKTPLTVIIGALSVASAKGVTAEQAQELTRDAATSAQSLAVMVNNLLELSRYQANKLALKLQPTRVDHVAGAVISKLGAVSEIHHLSVDMPPDLPVIMSDPIRVELIIHNLVENAIKYSPKGGSVRIAASLEGSQIIVGVSDEGIGISPENQARLFQSFERVYKGNIAGIGLGLRVCRILVEALGGKIQVDSEPGKGSTFRFTLPLEKS